MEKEIESMRVVDTGKAAEILGKSKSTLRKWACYENGPIRPVRIGRRLAWRISDLERILG